MKPTLLVLNPNATGWMTARVAEQLRAALHEHAQVEELTAADGPEVIDSLLSFEAAALVARHALQRRLSQAHMPGDVPGDVPAAMPADVPAGAPAGVLLACFGDPGLEALRAHWPALPIQGLAESAMARAAARGQRFAVLTCGPAWVDLLQQRAARKQINQDAQNQQRHHGDGGAAEFRPSDSGSGGH